MKDEHRDALLATVNEMKINQARSDRAFAKRLMESADKWDPPPAPEVPDRYAAPGAEDYIRKISEQSETISGLRAQLQGSSDACADLRDMAAKSDYEMVEGRRIIADQRAQLRNTDRAMRQACLELAERLASGASMGNRSARAVIEDAGKFYAFVSGETVHSGGVEIKGVTP